MKAEPPLSPAFILYAQPRWRPPVLWICCLSVFL